MSVNKGKGPDSSRAGGAGPARELDPPDAHIRMPLRVDHPRPPFTGRPRDDGIRCVLANRCQPPRLTCGSLLRRGIDRNQASDTGRQRGCRTENDPASIPRPRGGRANRFCCVSRFGSPAGWRSSVTESKYRSPTPKAMNRTNASVRPSGDNVGPMSVQAFGGSVVSPALGARRDRERQIGLAVRLGVFCLR